MTTNFSKIIAIAVVLFVSCKKEDKTQIPPPVIPPQQELAYIDMAGIEIKQHGPGGFIDLNKDGRKDVFFGSLLVGDPVNRQDKLHFLAGSDIDTRLPVNMQKEVPVLAKSERIPIIDFKGYSWYEASSVTLVQKVTGIETPVFWEGTCTNARRKYLLLQVIKNNQRFNGWVVLTVDIANEKIILHKAAISKIGEKEIKAG